MLLNHRVLTGRIWNREDLAQRFSLRRLPDPAVDIDGFIYGGYREHGAAFLPAVEGRFAVAYHDRDRKVIFLARDWMGEAPFHVIGTPKGFAVANSVSALRLATEDSYCYRYVRAVPQSKWLEIDVSHADERCVAETSRYRADALYYDFAVDCEAAGRLAGHSIRAHSQVVREGLERSVRLRLNAGDGRIPALLLSGGLDSFSIGLTLRALGTPFIAYTLAVDGQGHDAAVAKEFARLLGVEHRIVSVSAADIVACAPSVVEVAETYHLYNFYCAVGMYLLGRRLAADGLTTAFCGEAVNEAVGDYHDWTVRDPRSGLDVTLQHVNYDRMKNSAERLLYVWGQPTDRGKYNRQLGTGLAKHAASRMVKPFLPFGITLECPYYDRQVLSHLVAIPSDLLDRMGGKPGLFQHIFKAELHEAGVPEQLVQSCSKVRLQDATEGGGGGLTPVLLSAGFDQGMLLGLFNDRFAAGLDVRLEARRLVSTSA